MALAIAALISYAALLGPGVFAAEKNVAPYKIVSMKAFLYYEHDGTLSENIIDNPDFRLWNVMIGEGSAKGPSTSTLVVVEVQGTPGAYAPDRKVELTATSGGKTILKKATEMGVAREKGRFFMPFFLYDTGCFPVQLKARITGQTPEQSIVKTIKFAGGD